MEEEARKLGVAPKSLVDGDNLPAIAQVWLHSVLLLEQQLINC
jgi:hypothetical protein